MSKVTIKNNYILSKFKSPNLVFLNNFWGVSAIYRFEKAYDTIKKESLYDILIKFGVPKKVS